MEISREALEGLGALAALGGDDFRAVVAAALAAAAQELESAVRPELAGQCGRAGPPRAVVRGAPPRVRSQRSSERRMRWASSRHMLP